VNDSTTRFSTRAGDYARFRPSYPPEAIAAVLDGFDRPEVADLGAGTGISSRLLADAGAFVYAIEPNADMRAALPVDERIVAVGGTAEATHLEPLSVDIIAAFQAYHWFDPPRLFAEVDRIARRRARFVAVWNERDDSDAFTRAYSNAIQPFMSDDTETRRRASTIDADLSRFGWGPARVLLFIQHHPMTWEALIGRTRSASYLPRDGPRYDEMEAILRALFDDAARDGHVRMALTTSVHLGERQ
jgi:SAM-dependent methyltransferase